MNPTLSYRVLDAMRRIGDPYPYPRMVDEAYSDIAKPIGRDAPAKYFGESFEDKSWFRDPDDPDQLDTQKLERACNLFELYGSEIGGALLLAALPEAYAASTGSRILYELSALAAPASGRLTRRIEGTAQFLVNVMVAPICTILPDEVGTASPALQIARGLWGFDGPKRDVPVQRQQLGRALTATLDLRLRHQALRERAANKRVKDAEAAAAAADEEKKEAAAAAEAAKAEADAARAEADSPTDEEGDEESGPEDGTGEGGTGREGEPMPDAEVLLNQEDLLGTLLTFSVTVFEVLEQFGISWSADDQEAYLYAWDVVGHYLGVGTKEVLDQVIAWVGNDPSLARAIEAHTLRPQTVPEARQLLARIRQRVWSPNGNPNITPNQPFSKQLADVTPGRVLVRALIDDISTAMPSQSKGLPLRVIRQLAPPTVRDRLALGGTPARDLMFSYVPGGRATTGKFTHVDTPNRMRGWYLRNMSNDVVDRYFAELISRTLTIPGLVWGRPGDDKATEEASPTRRSDRAAPPKLPSRA